MGSHSKNSGSLTIVTTMINKINLMDYIEKNERRNRTYGSNDGKRTPFGRSNTSYGGFGTR